MQGLELSRRYYEEYGLPMIKEQFAEYENRIAVGLAGMGSDCFGFDDEISRDHDFGAGFCLWLTDEDNELFGFELARAYSRLPKEFLGFEKGKSNYYANSRYGVKTISDFYLPLTGKKGAPETVWEWLNIPEHSLAAAVNGSIFRDDLGEFTKIRETILCGMPEDIRLKKLSARAAIMAQSGQYNYPRCVAHGEKGAAALAVSEFVKNTVSLIYLINGKYAPFYKWALRGMENLEIFSDFAPILTDILTEDYSDSELKRSKIEKICSDVAEYFRQSGLSRSQSEFLEPHAYEIQNKIKDINIRSLHVMEG
jgi:hypothetical protein